MQLDLKKNEVVNLLAFITVHLNKYKRRSDLGEGMDEIIASLEVMQDKLIKINFPKKED